MNYNENSSSLTTLLVFLLGMLLGIVIGKAVNCEAPECCKKSTDDNKEIEE